MPAKYAEHPRVIVQNFLSSTTSLMNVKSTFVQLRYCILRND